jgi:AcrR family transcriptional regulator
MRVRRSRADISEQHRREVLEAAGETFLDRGFHGASIDAIALAAGFSKGVVYSQFGGKDELFLALLAERIEDRRADSARLADKTHGAEGFVTVVRNAIGTTAESVRWQALLLEFRAHAARHPATQARYAELHERAVAGTADVLGGIFERAGSAPPLPPRTMALLFLSVGTGLAAELLTTPDLDAPAIAGHIADGLLARSSQTR